VDCQAGFSSHSAFWVGLAEVLVKMTVQPGDRFGAHVAVGGDTVTISLSDLTRHATFSKRNARPAFTAAYIDLFSGLATWSLTAYSARRLVASLVGMAAGACVGDVMLRHAHACAPVVPTAVTAAVIAIAWVVLKPRATSGRRVRAVLADHQA
jgi:hypothetical protein